MKNRFLFLLFSLSVFVASAQINVTPSNSTGCAPHNVSFTATGGTWYRWNFDDGTPLTGYVPGNQSHTYVNPRNYPYYGFVYAYNSSFNYLGMAYFTVNVDGAVDSIGTSNYNPCPGDMVVLDLYPSTNPTNITWNFGDGNQLVNVNYTGVQHSYQTAGTYLASATFTTSCGTVTRYQTINVSNSGNFPNSNYLHFQASADTVCPGDNMFFGISYMYENFVIDFGDGNNSTTTTSHVYNTPGNYIARITYFNGCGNSITLTDNVVVIGNYPINLQNAYINRPDSACVNSVINFYPSPSTYASYNWDFGNSNYSHSVFPQQTYGAVGDYPITLTITNGCGYSGTLTSNMHIVNSIPAPPANILVLNDSVCPGGGIMFEADDISDNNDFILKWNFGDGSPAGFGRNISHAFANAGTYTVTLSITNKCGSVSTATASVFVGNNVVPHAQEYFAVAVPYDGGSSAPACVGDSVLFVFGPYGNTGTVYWNFGDNTNGFATKTVVVEGVKYIYTKHAYNSAGNYTYSCTYTNSCGNTFVSSAMINIGNNVNIAEGQIFVDDTKPYCQGKKIDFFAYGGNKYVWNFGDGSGDLVSYSTFEPVPHAFANPGVYTVTCKISNSCGYSITDQKQVTIPPSIINITANTVSSNCHFNDGKAIAIASGGEAPYTYQWSNGNTTFLADSLTSGIYVVTITDSRGCSNFSIATVSDLQAPVITVPAVINVSCYGGANGAIDINTIGNSGPYNYFWSNGSTTQDITQLQAGPYEVEVTDANGCKSTKSVLVSQPTEVVLSMVTSTAQCGQNTGGATVSVNGSTGPYAYIWSNGGVTPSITNVGLGIYTVTVVDANGCIYNKTAAVNENGGAIIVVDSISGTGCGNSLASVYIRPVLGESPYTYSWSTGATTQHLMNVPIGLYTVQVTSNNGCKSLKQIAITKENPQPTSICMVTVDTITGLNKCIFNKDTLATGIAGFNIYKESTISGLYFLIRHVPFTANGAIWTDSLSNSAIRSWRYKVSVVDNCGNESPLSGEHKTIHLNTNAGINGSYNLIWDHYEGFTFRQYNIYRYTQSGGWLLIDSVPNNIISYTDLNPPTNTYAYKVVAVTDFSCSTNGNRYESSNHILAAINSSSSNIKNLFSSTGIEDNVLNVTDFNLYPNPARGSVTLTCPYSSDGYVISVYNTVGALVYTSKESANNSVSTISINLSGLSEGVYHVIVQNTKGKINKKLVIY